IRSRQGDPGGAAVHGRRRKLHGNPRQVGRRRRRDLHHHDQRGRQRLIVSSSRPDRSAARVTVSPTGDEPEPIRAIRLKHPGRIIFAVILVLALAIFVIDAAQRPAYSWDNFAKYLFDKRISQAAGYTLL